MLHGEGDWGREGSGNSTYLLGSVFTYKHKPEYLEPEGKSGKETPAKQEVNQLALSHPGHPVSRAQGFPKPIAPGMGSRFSVPEYRTDRLFGLASTLAGRQKQYSRRETVCQAYLPGDCHQSEFCWGLYSKVRSS